MLNRGSYDLIYYRNRNEILVHLIQSTTKIIQSSRVNSLVSLKTILVILLKEIYVEKSNSVAPGLAEELKLAIVNCAEVALRRSTDEVIEQFYTSGHLIFVAQMLSVCVDLINKETYRQLRFVCIIFLIPHWKLNFMIRLQNSRHQMYNEFRIRAR